MHLPRVTTIKRSRWHEGDDNPTTMMDRRWWHDTNHYSKMKTMEHHDGNVNMAMTWYNDVMTTTAVAKLPMVYNEDGVMKGLTELEWREYDDTKMITMVWQRQGDNGMMQDWPRRQCDGSDMKLILLWCPWYDSRMTMLKWLLWYDDCMRTWYDGVGILLYDDGVCRWRHEDNGMAKLK